MPFTAWLSNLFLVSCRRQFDLASREAMDESAVWRKRYDDEEKKSSACQKELIKVGIFHSESIIPLVRNSP